jgi:hypothetical protein
MTFAPLWPVGGSFHDYLDMIELALKRTGRPVGMPGKGVDRE